MNESKEIIMKEIYFQIKLQEKDQRSEYSTQQIKQQKNNGGPKYYGQSRKNTCGIF
jgi:hypothetical protein